MAQPLTTRAAAVVEPDFDGFDELTPAEAFALDRIALRMCGVTCDGHDNDDPLKTLPLERWRDRKTAWGA